MGTFYGWREAGEIDSHGGEHIATTFLHVGHLPIVPRASLWVTDDRGRFAITSSTRSIFAAYLRVWPPLVAALAFVLAPLASALVLLVPLGAGFAWAWRARTLRGGHAIRSSAFNLVAFGTRCDPALMHPEHRRRCKRGLDDRWHRLEPDRPPEDVSELGGCSHDEAVVAYGLLRLAAVEAGTMRAALLADRILASASEAPDRSPYRSPVELSSARSS